MNAPSKDPQLESLKVPPHSIEAEQSVLGGLLLDNAAWDRIADFLSQSDFYRYDHRIIFEHIGKLIAATRPADVITVYEALGTSGKAEEVGGLAYLNALAQNTPSAANIRRYAEIVRDRAVLRRLVSVADEISADAFNPQGKEVRQLLDEAESKVFSIAEDGARGTQGFLEIGPLLTQVVERIDTLYHTANPSDVTGTPTGFVDLDRMTSGMHGGELIIVAGRPSMGKTAFSMNIGEYVAVEYGLPVAVFSMEMPGTQLTMRMLGSVGRLDQHRMRTGRLTDEDWPKLTHAVQKMSEAQIFIDETGGLNPMELRSRARRLSRQCGKLGLIIIDYLQLMSGSSSRRKPRDRNLGNLAFAQESGQRTRRAGDRVVAVESWPGTASEQAPDHVGLARIRRYRTGCRRHPVHLPRRSLQPGQPGQGHGGNHHR